MRLKIMFLTVAVLASATHVLAQGQEKDPQYYHFLMQNCPGKKLEVKLTNGQKMSGICEAQLVDRVQILREGVTHDIPYTSIAKMNVKRSWLSKCYGAVKDAVAEPYFYIYIIAVGLTSDDDFPW